MNFSKIKNIQYKFLHVLLSLTTLILFLAKLENTIATARPVRATVIFAEGSVKFQEPDSTKWITAEVGTKLIPGTIIKSGPDGKAVIKWLGSNIVKLSELSAITLTELDKEGEIEKTDLFIGKGRLFTKVKKLGDTGSTFQVVTPTAQAGVRGTEFFVDVTEENKTVFSVLEGQLSIIAAGVEMMLEDNLQTFVEMGAPPAEAIELPTEIQQELRIESQEVNSIISESESTKSDEKSGEKKEESKSSDSENTLQDIIEEQTQKNFIDEYFIPFEGCCTN